MAGSRLGAAALVAEVCRAGLLAVPRGQTDAARSLEMIQVQVFFRALFPKRFATWSEASKRLGGPTH